MVHAVIEDGYISQQEEDKQLCYRVRHIRAEKQVSSRQRKANEAEAEGRNHPNLYSPMNELRAKGST